MIAIGAIAGCSTAPTLPSADLPKLTDDERTADRPSDCTWPDFENLVHDGTEYNALNAEAWDAFLICVEIFDLNKDIAAGNADGLEAIAEMYDGTVELSERQLHYAQFLIEQVDADRRAAVTESRLLKGLLALGLIALAL